MNLRPETGNSLLSPGFHLFSQHSNSNLVFSPLSIHVLLGMIAVGSKGPAREQILRYLFTSSDHEPTAFFSETLSPVLADGSPLGGPVLSTANGLWADLSVNLKPPSVIYSIVSTELFPNVLIFSIRLERWLIN